MKTHVHSVGCVLSVNVESLESVSVVGRLGDVSRDGIIVGDSTLTSLTVFEQEERLVPVSFLGCDDDLDVPLEERVVEVSSSRVEDTSGTVRVTREEAKMGKF